MKILQITGFPNNGAGSGTLITTQAKSLLEQGHEVACILSENQSDFPRVPGVTYYFVPFTADEKPETIEGQLPFNFPMFTTHTRSKNTFWTMPLEQIKGIEQRYREVIAKAIEEFQPDVIHGNHNWIHNEVATEFGIPTVVTIHGTDLEKGYDRAQEYQNAELERIGVTAESGIDKQTVIDCIKMILTLRESHPEQAAESTANLLTRLQKNGLTLTAEDLEEVISKTALFQHYREMAEKSAANSQRAIVISTDQERRFKADFPQDADKALLIANGYSSDVFYKMKGVDKKALREEILGSLTSANTPDGRIPTDVDYVITFVGKFADFKGIDVLLDAAKEYETAFENMGKKIATVIVGSGDLEEPLKAQAKELGLRHTHFVGRHTADLIRPLQNVSDVSLIPSRNEPFGLVVIEGTACGHPVIGTNSGGIPDIMNTTGKVIKVDYDPSVDANDPNVVAPDAGTKGTYTLPLGMMVPKDDAHSLAEAVVKVCTDEGKTWDSDAIAEYTKATYDQDSITHKLVQVYEEAIVSKKKLDNPDDAEHVINAEDKPMVLTLKPKKQASVRGGRDDD